MARSYNRGNSELRPVVIEPNYIKYPLGSTLTCFGDTKVITTVSIEDKLPSFLENKEEIQGWLTAEYALLPGSSQTRNPRAGYGSNTIKGRVYEIQRLIGRSLRAALDLKALGPFSIYVDCDVIQADGGTRTAAITGGMVALELAMQKLLEQGKIKQNPVIAKIAAVSVGIVDGEIMLDLDYSEDSTASVDLNLVMDDKLNIIEIQGASEKGKFTKSELDKMIEVGIVGIKKLFEIQNNVLADIMKKS